MCWSFAFLQKGTAKDRPGHPPLLDNSKFGQPQTGSKQHMEICLRQSPSPQAIPHPKRETVTLQTPGDAQRLLH